MFKLLAMIVFLLVSICKHAHAVIIFEDNFDNTSNWQSNQKQSKLPGCGGSDVIEFSNNCTTNCPPTSSPGQIPWTGGYYASSIFCSDPGKQLYNINSNDPRGGEGKSIESWIEISNGWTGGRLIKKLDTPQTQLYYRFYVKYPSGFVFSDGTDNGYQKLLSVSSYPPNDPVNGQIFGRGSNYYNSPDFIWQNYTNKAYYNYNQYQINPAPRTAPGYGTADDDKTADAGALQTIDGGWHCVEVGLRLNSAPGAKDGFFETYFDGVKTHSNYSIAWVKSATWSSGTTYTAGISTSALAPSSSMKGFRPVSTHISSGPEPNWEAAVQIGDIVTDGNGNKWEYFTDWRWNVIWLLDNIYIGASKKTEQVMYADDVVVSTDYIGPDYKIINTNSLTIPKQPVGFMQVN